MKKIGILLVLLVTSTSTLAEWKDLGFNDQMKIYYDPSSIRRNGSTAKAWTMDDFKAPVLQDGITISSLKGLIEIDCRNEQARILATIFYFRKMGLGGVAQSDNTIRPWRPIAPETVNSNLYEVLCQ